MKPEFTVGDATNPQGSGPKVLAHICNDIGAWGLGFVLAVSRRWRGPEATYRTVSQHELGHVTFIEVEPRLWVANMIGQHGIRSIDRIPPIRYDAVRQALGAVREFANSKRASVHMPRIGSGLAGGRWEVLEGIIQEELCDHEIKVVVYDLPKTTG